MAFETKDFRPRKKRTTPEVEDNNYFENLDTSPDEAEDSGGQSSIGSQLRTLLDGIVAANRSAAKIRGKLFAEGEASDPKKESGNKSVESLVHNCRVELGDLVKQLASINSRL